MRGVRYYSLIDGTGYGSAGLANIQCLLEQGVEVRWSPLVQTQFGLAPWHLLPVQARPKLSGISQRQDALIDLVEKEIEYQTVVMHVMPELYPKLLESGKKNIAYTVWETDQLPDHWPALIGVVDKIIVPCKSNVGLFTLSDGPPVECAPHFLESEPSEPANLCRTHLRSKFELAPSTYVFYSINAWAPRKAILETLHSYLLAFTDKDDVCMLIKTDETGQDFDPVANSSFRPTRDMLNEVIALYPDPPAVKLLDRWLDDQQLMELHFCGDCYFSMAHSEGWGLGAYRAAQSGNPVIITGWGGQLDYLSEHDAYLIDYSLSPVVETQNWESYTNNQQWAIADVDHAISLLKRVHKNPQEAALRGVQLKQTVELNFSYEKNSAKLMNAIFAHDS